MVTRRSSPKVVFDPNTRPPLPSGPVRMDIAGALAQRRAQTDSSGRTSTPTPTDPAPSSHQSGTHVLKSPGELERVIKQIMEGFQKADSTHRAAIDQQVMECFRVASFLKHNRLGGDRLLGGEWVKYWGMNGRNGDAALKFVFKKVHTDAKKASFYYRATRKLFEEGVRIGDIAARVTAAGGYQELADKNVKSPRAKAAVPPAAANEARAGGFVSDPERTIPRRTRGKRTHPPSAEKILLDSQDGDRFCRQFRMMKVTASDGIAFFTLQPPCVASLDVHLSQDDDGDWLMNIVGMSRTE